MKVFCSQITVVYHFRTLVLPVELISTGAGDAPWGKVVGARFLRKICFANSATQGQRKDNASKSNSNGAPLVGGISAAVAVFGTGLARGDHLP